MKKLLTKYWELIAYGFWGAATTVVNYAVYFLCTRLFHIDPLVSNALAWAVAVAFAYVVNKLFVFASRSWRRAIVFRELWQFVSARILSGALETLILFIFVNLLKYDDGIVKIIANILVIIINYFLSKFLIFRKSGPQTPPEQQR